MRGMTRWLTNGSVQSSESESVISEAEEREDRGWMRVCCDGLWSPRVYSRGQYLLPITSDPLVNYQLLHAKREAPLQSTVITKEVVIYHKEEF